MTAVRGLKLNALAVPQWLAEKYLDVEEMHAKKPVVMQSRSDKLIVQRIKTRDIKETLLANSLVDGFRLDLNFPEIKLNVELDGPTHKYPARARYDRSRDEFLSKTKGYTVYRIELEGKSVDEIIALVEAKVAEAAETSIQNMYSH